MTTKIYVPGQTIDLIHKDGSAPKEPGSVRLECDGRRLYFYADLIDSEVHNSAERNNVKTWLTGDVIELFFQPKGRDDYYEFHVTPNGKTLQLHMPHYTMAFITPPGAKAEETPSVSAPGENTRKRPSFEDLVFESGFQASAELTVNGWRAKMMIPLDALDNAVFWGGRTASARHNHHRAWPKPEVSVSTVFPGSVHQPDLWHVIG